MLRYVDEHSAAVWCETQHAATVEVTAGEQTWSVRTFAVHGHHYALVQLDNLPSGTIHHYRLHINGTQEWPEPTSTFPPSSISTLQPGRPLTMSFGSCRTSVPHNAAGNATHGIDALRATAIQLANDLTNTTTNKADASPRRPDLLLFLGDQVYADSTSAAMQEFIEQRRDISEPPGDELADFEEYAYLYRLAWSDPANRWLLSTVSTAMIFDDHDIRDDWNASLTWREQMEETSWWRGRIVAGLASYWLYQHLGNLAPTERADDPIWRLIAEHTGPDEIDVTEALDEFADRCDRDPASYRWSFARDFGDTRLIVLDSRAARELDPANRAVIDQTETRWLDEQMHGGFRHLLIGTSLPFLLPTGLHHLESWNEAISEGAWGARAARWGEKLRQGLDLEHWAAFQKSFRALARLAVQVADGKRGPAPETVTFLSGDVHYSYVSEVERTSGSRIIQAVCSPIRNPLPILVRSFTAVVSYGLSSTLTRRMARSAGVKGLPFRWKNIKGPWFDNCLGSLAVTDEGLKLWWTSGSILNGDYDRPAAKRLVETTIRRRNSR
jgi:hypothetical protein